MAGFVIDEKTLEAQRSEGDTASTRVAVDASCGCERLEQRVIRFASGRSQERVLGDRQELLYVAAGGGTLRVNGEPYELEPDMGVYLTPGDS
jgi:mannose-6-phosphate isomerase-like protein (cupin superfamily)